MLKTSSLVRTVIAPCAAESTALQYPSSNCKDKTVAEEFACVALHRVENNFSGKQKEEFVAPEITACWYVFSFL